MRVNQWLLGLVFASVACSVLGCTSHEKSAVRERTFFEPADLNKPVAITVPDADGPPAAPAASRAYLGTKSRYAQPFVVPHDGTLVAVQLDVHSQGKEGDFVIEIVNAMKNGEPPESTAQPLARINVPHENLPSRSVSSDDRPRLLTFDLTPFHVAAKKGMTLVVATRYTEDGDFGLSGVAGKHFPVGPLYQRSSSKDPWHAVDNFTLAFRVIMNSELPTTPATTEQSTELPNDRIPAGDVIAEALYQPLGPPRFLRRVGPLVPPVPLQTRAFVFESKGKWYIQTELFNGSASPQFVTTPPSAIAVVRVADGEGFSVSVSNRREGFGGGMEFNAMAPIQPNEGTVRVYLLSNKDLEAGDYRATVAYAPETTSKVLEVPFTVQKR